MKRVLPVAVVLSALFAVSAQAQSYTQNSGYPTTGNGSSAYTTGYTTPVPYQNQGMTGTNAYSGYQDQNSAGTQTYNPYQNQNAAGTQTYNAYQNQNAAGTQTYNAYQNQNAAGTQTYNPYQDQNSAGTQTYNPYQNQNAAGGQTYNAYQNQSTYGVSPTADPYNSSAASNGSSGIFNSAGIQNTGSYTNTNNGDTSYTDPNGTSNNLYSNNSASGIYDANTGNSADSNPFGNILSPTGTVNPYPTDTPSPMDVMLNNSDNTTAPLPGVTPSPLPLSSLTDIAGSPSPEPISNTENDVTDLSDGQTEDVGDPLYNSTKQYMEKLRANGYSCQYRGKQGASSESVFASFNGSNVTLNTIAVFSDTETDCILYVLRFVNFEGKNTDLVSPLLDALNADYRFAKFYSAPTKTVSVTLDLLFTADNAGDICYDGLRRLLSICDECYEALSSSIEALPDEGEGISDWDDSTVDNPDTAVPPYNSPAPTASPAPQVVDNTAAQSSQGGQVVRKVKIRNGGSVNVRMAPDQNSILVGTAEGGRIYDCLSVADNGWYEIVLPNGMTGFISGKRVTELNQ